MKNKQHKLLIKKLLVFLLPLLLLCFYLEYNLRNQHFSCSYAIKKYNFEKQLDSIETLVLGSSHALCGIDVGWFNTKAFNMANVSQTLYYDKAITLKYLHQLKKLHTVIINIDYFSFFYQLCDTKENWREDYYKTFFDIDGCKQKNKNLLYLQTFNFKHAASLAFKAFKDDVAVNILNNGYQPRLKQLPINDTTGFERVKLHHEENFKKRRNEIENELEEFVKILINKNIKIVFVTTPSFNTYTKFCDKKTIDQNTLFINTICKKYNTKYLDFFTDNSLTKEHFYDNDHLNSFGASRFSKMLSDSLKL